MPHATPGGRLGVSDWVHCGVTLTPGTTNLAFQRTISTGAGGSLVGWSDQRNGTNLDIFASQLGPTGNLVSGWAAGGNVVSVSDSSQLLVSAGTDNAGGAFFVYTNVDPQFANNHDGYLQHMTSSGTVAGGYPANGKTMVTGEIGTGGMLPDGSGGLFFGWSTPSGSNIRVTRLDASGTATAGWPAIGIDTGVLDQVNGEPEVDGAGGIYLTWSTATELKIQRFGPTGAVAGWPVGGLTVATPGGEVNPRAVKLSNNDALVAWVDPTTLHVLAMRVNAAGTVDAGWPAGGKQVSTGAGEEDSPEIVADAAGGGLVLWQEPTPPFFLFGNLYLQRLTSSGGISAGWAAAGVPLMSTQSAYESFNLLSDGANGAIAAWTDLRNGSDADIYTQRIVAGGTTAPGFDADGVVICDATPGDQTFPEIVWMERTARSLPG
jgi:hypothetical protein